MKAILGVILCVCVAVPAFAEDMRATVLEIHDGDTIFIRPEGDCLPVLFQRIGLRLNGCDTPELKDQRPDIRALANEAKDYAANLLQKGQAVTIKGVKWDKYGGRIDGVLEVNGQELCRLLIDAGLAREYHGQGAKPW